MRKLHYHLVDVFTDRAFGGNQLAVCTDGAGLPTDVMQSIAKEFNLAETTFVLPRESDDSDYRLRIFTPGTELPMAGHPTVGTTFVLARERMIPWTGSPTTVRLEEGVGVLPVAVTGEEGAPEFVTMSQPLPTFGATFEDRDLIAEMLTLDASAIDPDLPVQTVSCGVPFLFIPLAGLDAIRAVSFRADVWDRVSEDVGAHGAFIFCREVENAGSTVHSRMFAPDLGIHEDPATGGASGPLGSYLVRYGVVESDGTARFVSEQGIELGRPSFIHIEIDHAGDHITGVRVGGQCHYMGQGFLELDGS